MDHPALERVARRMIEGRGDPAAGEWMEARGNSTTKFFHLRRRLSVEERGDMQVLDLRGTAFHEREMQKISTLTGVPVWQLRRMG